MMAASVFASGLINPIGLRAAGLDGALPGLGSHTIHWHAAQRPAEVGAQQVQR